MMEYAIENAIIICYIILLLYFSVVGTPSAISILLIPAFSYAVYKDILSHNDGKLISHNSIKLADITGGKETEYNDKYVVSRKIVSDFHGHMYNKSYGNSLEPYISKYFTNGSVPKVSHLQGPNVTNESDNFSIILNDKSKKAAYSADSTYRFKHSLHWGQLKLMLTEIEFLTLAIRERCRLNQYELPIYLVYAGAAPGHHIAYLSNIFPEIFFELYDPNPFVIKDSRKVKTHVQFFLDEDAKYWKKQQNTKFIIFTSDIRTEPATEEAVIEDMERQFKWWEIMNPHLTMYKFRLPWAAGKTRYAEGDIYVQPFAPHTSTETRIIIKKDARIIDYDNSDYEGKMFYHNTVSRGKYYGNIVGEELSIEDDGIDNCYDCTRMVKIIEDYMLMRGIQKGLPIKIKIMIREIQREITGKHTILSQTVRNLNESLYHLYKACYNSCDYYNCEYCLHVKNSTRRWAGQSNATKENLIIAMKKHKN